MEEDETVVLRNTGLRSYLREAGFEDFEVIDEDERSMSPSPVSDNSNNFEKTRPHVDYEDFEILIYTILESHLVFNDDVLFVKNFAVHMKPLPTTPTFNFMYTNIAIQTVAVSTGCLACSVCGVKVKPWIYIPLHVIPLGIHTVKHIYTTFHKRNRRKKLVRLLESSKKLSMLMQKSIQFVNESEILAFNNFPNQPKFQPGIPNTYIGEWKAMHHLRLSTFHAIRSGILDLKRLIIILVNNFPLKSHVTSLSFHLAFLDEMDLQCSYSSETLISIKQLQQMKYVYLLLQSEFLRQLSLCFVPSLWVCNASILLRNTFILLSDFNDRCASRYQQLKSIFEVYYTCENTDRKNKLNKNADPKWLYKEAYVKLCSLSFNLQTILRNSRIMEEFLEQTRTTDTSHENVVLRLDDLSEHIERDHDRCKLALDDLRKYVLSLKPKMSTAAPVAMAESSDDTTSVKTNVVLGVTDFNPDWPDEVFVGVSQKDSTVTESEAVSSEDAVKNPCSKILISELKIALQSKAKEWKEREKIALKNKNIEIEDDDVKKQSSGSSSSEEELRSLSKLKFAERDSEYKFKPISTSESTFAKEIKKASAAWRLQSEEFVGEDEDE